MALFQVLAIILVSALFAEGELCRDKSQWCPQMTTHGACGFHKPTQEKCPRRCGLCAPKCQEVLLGERRECGHPGIGMEQCERRGCCFNVHNGDKTVPWCHYAEDQCKFVEAHKRRDCGHSSISRNECLDKGCCWSPLLQGSKHPWCHHSEDVTDNSFGSGFGE